MKSPLVGLGVVAMAAVVSGCFFDSRMLSMKGVSAQQSAERDAAEKLMPAALDQPHAVAPAALRTVRARAWVDAGYRRRVHWREHLQEVVARANEFLGDAFGVNVEVEAQPWDHDGEVEDLDQLLRELAEKDPGDGVDHVIGLTGGLSRVVAVQEQLGRASVLGKHMVLRDMSGALERQALAEAFPTLSQSELDRLHAARSAHKEVCLFLHEWAHNYGALHEAGTDLIMSPEYRPSVSHFSDGELDLVRLGLRARAGDAAATEDLRQLVARSDSEAWDPRDREQLLATLGPGNRVPTRASSDAPGVIQAVRRADEQREAGALRQALATLDERAHDAASATDWLQLGVAYARLGAYQRADAAFARAEADARSKAFRAETQLVRRQRGVFGVGAEDEPEASAAFEAAYTAYEAQSFDGARRKIDAGLGRWHDLAGLLALRCAIELHDGNTRVAKTSCARALAVSRETILACYYAGHLAAQAGRKAEAIGDFERTIALNPDEPVAYTALARLVTGAKLVYVRRAFRERFKRELVP
jgi:tetratricopeptide (TPR) repeat protein